MHVWLPADTPLGTFPFTSSLPVSFLRSRRRKSGEDLPFLLASIWGTFLGGVTVVLGSLSRHVHVGVFMYIHVPVTGPLVFANSTEECGERVLKKIVLCRTRRRPRRSSDLSVSRLFQFAGKWESALRTTFPSGPLFNREPRPTDRSAFCRAEAQMDL